MVLRRAFTSVILIATCCQVGCVFFRDTIISSDIAVVGAGLRIPIRATSRSNKDAEIELLQHAIDRTFLELMLQASGRALADYASDNGGTGGSLIGHFAGQLKMLFAGADNANEIFGMFGIREDVCRKKFVCELYSMLSSSNDYKSRFLLWFIDRHVPGISSIVDRDLRRPKCLQQQRNRVVSESDCDRRYRGTDCRVSLRQLMTTTTTTTDQ